MTIIAERIAMDPDLHHDMATPCHKPWDDEPWCNLWRPTMVVDNNMMKHFLDLWWYPDNSNV